MTRISLLSRVQRPRRPRCLWAVALCVTSTVMVRPVAHAQNTSRPQLVVDRAEADLTIEMLFIEGRKLLWTNDSEIVVTLANMPLTVISAMESDSAKQATDRTLNLWVLGSSPRRVTLQIPISQH
jgi:hypothetical protein